MGPNYGGVSRSRLYETAVALLENLVPDELDSAKATLLYLYHTDASVDPETFRSQLPTDITLREAKNVIYQLRLENILTDDHLNEQALLDSFELARILTIPQAEQEPENSLVATIPDDAALDQWQFDSLVTETLHLVRRTQDELVLMSPFLNADAYRTLRPALRSAASRNATITLITRNLTYGDEEYNREFVRLLLDDEMVAEQTQFYEYINRNPWLTFHAKVILSDTREAYLGTANITSVGMDVNLELGVIFRDSTVSEFRTLIESLRMSEYFHQITAQRVDSGWHFYRTANGT